MNGKNEKIRCAFCFQKRAKQMHHNYNAEVVKMFLSRKIIYKDPVNSEQLKKETIRIQREGGYLPLCPHCHHAWEAMIHAMVLEYKKKWMK